MNESSSIKAANLDYKTTDITFSLAIIFMLAIMFIPIPTILIDFGLAVSLSLSILILMVALWINRPLDFSAFPTVLLITTMLRLSLNIATTRTILAHGAEGTTAAGYMISGFSGFVMGGDFLIGLVVFIILVIVNFVVITKGSTRIAEVGARFTLDAIPGKQMSIDADLSAGIIDEKVAQARRSELEEESAFFGSMDGASKFVRGDAVAGLIITAVNIFGGMLIGIFRHGMPASEAADVFVKLSVGDGIVTQIPALIVSLAAGLIVSKGGTRGTADHTVLKQLGAYPRALFVAAALLFGLGLMPGLPTLPFAVIGGMLFVVGQKILGQRKSDADNLAHAANVAQQAVDTAEANSAKNMLRTSEIELVMGRQLAASQMSGQQELAFRMAKMRRKFATDYGYVIPEIKVSEDLAIPAKSYQIRIQGSTVASYSVRIDEILALIGNSAVPALPGEEVNEPAFGMRAYSVPANFAEDLRQLGLQGADNISVILTHLSEVIRSNLSQLLSYRDMRALIERLEPEYRKLADEICSNHLTYPGLQAALKALLSERVSIRNLHIIIESIAEIAGQTRRTDKLVEHVRQRLSQQICSDIATEGILSVLRLGPRWDLAFHENVKRDTKGETLEFSMEPRLLERFVEEARPKIDAHTQDGTSFAIVTSQEARPFVRLILERIYPGVPVLSHSELARGFELNIIGSIS
ncbi:MAG: flagellar biosynthesis protein FlhA [Rhizobiaceae bacterium]